MFDKTKVFMVVLFVIGLLLGWEAKTIKVEAALKDGYVPVAQYNTVIYENQKLNKILAAQIRRQKRSRTEEIPINLHPDKKPTIGEWKSNLKR